MTTTMPPHGPGSRRAIPQRPDDDLRKRLRRWLEQDTHWVMRPNWDEYLRDGTERGWRPLEELTHDQRIAALAWLSQQRHALHRALEGAASAPDGWLEAHGVYRALEHLIEVGRPASIGAPGFAD